VHHRVVALGVHHRAAPQPSEQLGAIGRLEHLAERVVLARALGAFELRHEMKIVVSEHRHRALAEVAHEAQHLERLGSAVHQIAEEPQSVPGAEIGLAQQLLQLIEAALHVAQRVRRHARGLYSSGGLDQKLASRRRYWIASAMCSAASVLFCARSAMVRATRNTRW
jgi:hypothetical protein